MSEHEEVMAPADGSDRNIVRAALRRRQLISQAVGILMQRDRCGQAAALAELIDMSTRSDTDVGVMADILVRTTTRP